MAIKIDPNTGAPIIVNDTPETVETPASVETAEKVETPPPADFVVNSDVPNESNTDSPDSAKIPDSGNSESVNEPHTPVSDVAPLPISEKSAKDILAEKVMAILVEYNHVEADIPYNHEYWQLRNQMLAYRR